MATKLSISIFVKELEAALSRKDGYIMGARGQNPKTGSLDLSVTKESSSWKTTGWYFTQYSGSQKAKALYWREHATRVWDCNGLAEGIYEIHTGVNINQRARNNYADWCDPKGTGLIPTKYRVPGAAVFWKGSSSYIHHVGYLYKPVVEGKPEGDWYIIEARGVNYGVVKTKLNSRKPDRWGWMTKYFDYDNTTTNTSKEETSTKLGSRILKKGMSGNDVKELQNRLIALGYSLPKYGADGDYGTETVNAVKAFQKDKGLTVDGEFGPKSLAALEAASTTTTSKSVKIINGNCNVRAQGNTSGSILGVAHKGETYTYAGETNSAGWNKIVFKEKEGWVSGKYSQVE